MTGPQGAGVFATAIMIPSDIGGIGGGTGLGGIQEPIIDGRFAGPNPSAGGPAAVGIMFNQATLLGQAYDSDAAASAWGEEIGRVVYTTSGRTFILCRHLSNYFYRDIATIVNPFTGTTPRGLSGCGAVLSLIDPTTPVGGTIAGVPGTVSCKTTPTVTTGPNQRALVIFGSTGTGVPTAPAGYKAVGSHTSITGIVGRAQLYISNMGSFPEEGSVVPAAQFYHASNSYSNCTMILLNGYDMADDEPVIVSSRTMMNGGTGHTMSALPGAMPGDVWVQFAYGAQLNSNNAHWFFGQWDNILGNSYRFGLVNDREAHQDGDYYENLESLAAASGGVNLHMLMRNVRRAYPISDWGTGISFVTGGTFPNFTIPAGPAADNAGIAADIMRWANNGMYVIGDDRIDSGQRATSGQAQGIMHAVPIAAGAQKPAAALTMGGTTQTKDGGYSVTVVGQAQTRPERKFPRPTLRANQRFSTAGISHVMTSFTIGSLNMPMYACMASQQPVSAVSAGWTIIDSYQVGSTCLCVARKVTAAGTENLTWTMSASTVGWASVIEVFEGDPSEQFIKHDNFGTGAPPYTHDFDFSDIDDGEVVCLAFMGKGAGTSLTQSGPNVNKNAVNKIWHGPDWTSLSIANIRHEYATAIIDKSVSDPADTLQWTGTSGAVSALAICIGLVGRLVGDAPTVTINKAASQADPETSYTASIVFDVVFSEAVTGFATGDVDLGSSTCAGDLLGTVAGSGTTYTVTVTGMTSAGDVIARIPANVCTSFEHVPNLASTSTDNTVAFSPPPATVTSLGGASFGAGTGDPASTTIDLTGLTIPDGAVVLVMASCGLDSAGATTAAATGITFNSFSTHNNTATTPDRLTTLLYGVANGAGSTITVTFPGSTAERMIAACYLTNAPTTNNGLDALHAAAHDHTNNFNIIQTPAALHSQLGFAWIAGDASGGPITGTGATQVLDFSPAGGDYTVAIVKWVNGQVNPVMSSGTSTGGTGISLELKVLLT